MQIWLWALGGVLAVASTPAIDGGAVQKAQGDIGASCGYTPAVVVEWDGFGDDVDAKAGLNEGGFGFLTSAFADVCKDAALKAEVGKQISKIVLTQAYGAADPVIYLARKTLHIEYLWARGVPGPDTAYVRDEIAARLRGEEAEAP